MAVKAEIRVSVRNLVEFVLRSGNIDNRKAAMPENAMLEGGRIHRMIQRRMGADYHAEVGLKYQYETEDYVIIVEGRADGIIAGTDTAVQAESLFLMDKGKENSQRPGYRIEKIEKACERAFGPGKMLCLYLCPERRAGRNKGENDLL